MRHSRLILALGLLFATITRPLPAAGAPAPTVFEKPPASIPGATRHVFKQAGRVELPLYLFAPAEARARPVPVVIFFHGSGWHSGTLVQFVEHARALAHRGIAAAVAEYRIKVDYDATPFDGLADVKSAIRWLRAHAGELGIDPRRVVAAGGSAGAHLALCSAVFTDKFDDPSEGAAFSSVPDALVLFAVVTDLSPSAGEPAPNPLFNGRERELSPILHLRAGLPPMQIFQGTSDRWALPARNERFADAVQARGGICDYIVFEGRDHFFYNHPAYYGRYPRFTPASGRDDFELCLLLMTRFLHQHGFLPQRPVVGGKGNVAP